VREMAEGLAADLVESHCSDEVPAEDWDLKTLDDAVFAQFNVRMNLPETAAEMPRAAGVEELVVERVQQAYAERETTFTPPVMRHLERVIWLQTLDSLWRDHLLSMDHLKEGIGLRGYGQKNPLQEYQKEGYDLFEELIRRMEADVVEKLMSVQLQAQPATMQAQLGGDGESADFEPELPAAVIDMQRRQEQAARQRIRLSHGGPPTAGAQKVETVRRDAEKVGRNDPCPCGSGKKFKKCHGAAA
jgi:preprotein translocase subunit SecA